MSGRSPGIRQRSPGTWQIVVHTGRRDEQGRYARITRTIRGPKKEAERQRAELVAQLAAGTYFRPAREPVVQFLARWLETEHNLRPGSRVRYEYTLKHQIIPKLNPLLLLPELDASHVSKLINLWREGGAATSSIRLNFNVLHRAMDAAVRMRLIQRNPVSDVKPPRLERVETAVLDEAALVRALAELDQTYFRVVYRLLVHTGMRVGEALGLRWRDVDLEAGTIRVAQQYTLRKTFEPTKTYRSKRLVDIDQHLVAILRAHRAEQNAKRLIAGSLWQDFDLVCSYDTGQPLSHSAVHHPFKRIMGRLGHKTLRLHDLRHTHASILLANGADVKLVSERLGHASPVMTLGIYSHVLPGRGKDVAERFGQRLVDQAIALAVS